jgi:predicted ArsR family transcriptional regulator
MGDVPDELSHLAARIGALAEPVRRELYEYVVAQPDAVSREQAADGVDVPRHTAKFHLDRLVDEGLLETEFRRLTGRTGPGAGRPAKLYGRADRGLSVSLPERRYDLAGEILAEGVERSLARAGTVEAAVRTVATELGRAAGAASSSGGEEPERASDALAAHGYEPRRDGDELLLVNCPFDALAREHTELVCGLNEAFVGGLLEGADCEHLCARLEPEEGLCCVKVRPVSTARGR